MLLESLLSICWISLVYYRDCNKTVLAAWMRLKYPHIAIGAVSASAPILQFEDIVPTDTFYRIVSEDFKVIPPKLASLLSGHVQLSCNWIVTTPCPTNSESRTWSLMQRESTSCFNYIRDSWDVINKVASENDGLHNLSTVFHMCRYVLSPSILSFMYLHTDIGLQYWVPTPFLDSIYEDFSNEMLSILARLWVFWWFSIGNSCLYCLMSLSQK